VKLRQVNAKSDTALRVLRERVNVLPLPQVHIRFPYLLAVYAYDQPASTSYVDPIMGVLVCTSSQNV